jgi:hypothetical protein
MHKVLYRFNPRKSDINETASNQSINQCLVEPECLMGEARGGGTLRTVIAQSLLFVREYYL